MDFDEGIGSCQEDLALGQFARPRFRQPLDLRKTFAAGGTMFEIDDDEDDWDLFEDIEEENYEDDTYRLFHSFEPADTRMRVMETDSAEGRRRHFDASQINAIKLDTMEQQMDNVNEEGTVKKMVIKQGNGLKVPKRCRLYFHYMAIAEGTCEPFDTSLIRKYPHRADLRQEGILLPGLEQAVRSMELSEAARFIVYPSLAFGESGCPPRVPANVKILYIVETLQYIDEEKLNTPLYMSLEERNALPFEQILKLSDDLRTQGNGCYTEKRMQEAIKKWRKGVQILEDYAAADEVICSQRTEILHTLYANMAQAYLKLEKPAQACSACKIGLKMVDGMDSIKLLYRFARAKLMLKDTDAALGLVERGLRIDLENEDLRKLENEIRKEDGSQIKAYKKMWSGIFKPKANSSSDEVSNAPRRESKKLYPELPRSDSLLGIQIQEEASKQENRFEVQDCVQQLNDLKIDDSNDYPRSDYDIDDLVTPYMYCSDDYRKAAKQSLPLSEVNGEENNDILDTLPSPFFDISELNEENENVVREENADEKSEGKSK